MWNIHIVVVVKSMVFFLESRKDFADGSLD